MLNPFDKNNSNVIMTKLKDLDANISALIMITNQVMAANMTYHYPKLISMMSETDAERLTLYSIQDGSKDVRMTIEHTFIDHCNLVDPIVATYIVFTLLWIAILITYWIHTIVMNKDNALYL